MRRECRERFPRHRIQIKPLVSDPDMHHVTCVTHVRWCMSGSLTRGGRGKRSRHSRRMPNPQFDISDKRPMAIVLCMFQYITGQESPGNQWWRKLIYRLLNFSWNRKLLYSCRNYCRSSSPIFPKSPYPWYYDPRWPRFVAPLYIRYYDIDFSLPVVHYAPTVVLAHVFRTCTMHPENYAHYSHIVVCCCVLV